jgi:hypothetical protein
MFEVKNVLDHDAVHSRQPAEKTIKCADRRIFILEAEWKTS